jgi:hypothetical protein
MTSLDAPMPRVNRPPDSSASDTAVMPSTMGVRVCTGTTATPRSASVVAARAPSEVNASGPLTSLAHTAP